jgi:hypothetical protein
VKEIKRLKPGLQEISSRDGETRRYKVFKTEQVDLWFMVYGLWFMVYGLGFRV